MSKRIAIFVVIVVAAAVIIGIVRGRGNSVQYVTVPVSRGNLVSYVEETGTLNPLGNTTVSVGSSVATVSGGVTVGAQVTGRITNVYVNFNSHVKKGQILAQIDPLPYQAAVDQDNADLNSAQDTFIQAGINVQSAESQYRQDEASLANVTAAKQRDEATLKNDRINYEREKVLFAQNFDSKQNLDNAYYALQSMKAVVESDAAQIQQAKAKIQSSEIGVKIAEEQVALAKAVIEKSRAKLKADNANLSYTRIVSPVDGVVMAKNIDVGQTVVSSFQSPNLFVIAQNLKKMQIDALVDEADINKIHSGQKAVFNVASHPNKNFEGTVSQIQINPINQQNVVDYDVIVKFNNPGRQLIPGMQADVKFIVADRKNILKIPNQALRFVPPTEKTKIFSGQGDNHKYLPHVWLLENGKAVRQNVKLGVASDTETEITDGLAEGDLIITDVQLGKKGPRTLLF